MTKSFHQKLTHAIDTNNSLLCVGLDANPHKYPTHFLNGADSLAQWGQTIIEQTADLVCCYKPNIAFYEQYGPAGLEALKQIIDAVPSHIPVLLDAKRGDIGILGARGIRYWAGTYQLVWNHGLSATRRLRDSNVLEVVLRPREDCAPVV